MPFPKQPAKVPAKPGRVTVAFAQTVDPAGTPQPMVVTINFDVIDASGNVVGTQTVDGTAELTSAQKTALGGILGALRTRIQNEAI